MKRSTYNFAGGVCAAILAFFSLLAGLGCTSKLSLSAHNSLAHFVIGFWVLFPPVFFWVDWVWFCRHLSKDALDVTKHTHDLSRNIWLALIVVLAVLFDVNSRL